ncbi:DUF1707 domain-containing protein [Actinomadura sp. 7K507]|uniref:DUF1707 SHOCT-like domain-containing protein n=1 Tax=Actinomadura sp. 7K507 TaxID=2530365 RepID=UPI001A9EE4BD|nr:DUF1707 domain-containing protein [Actinomadura sp. 7K507]
MRVSHAERDAAVDRLRDATAEGRIDLDELEARLDAALTAKTYDDLAALTADLPSAVPEAPAPPLVLNGGMHGASRTGRWQVPSRITANGGMAGVKLDFTRTECRLPEIEIEAHGQLAGVTIVLPDGWAVDTTGLEPGLSGGLKNKTTPDRLAGTPLVRLTGTGGAAGVVVRHPNRWERRKLADNPPR